MIAVGGISSDLDRSSLCDIEKSSFKSFEIGQKMILPAQLHTLRITKTLLGHLPDFNEPLGLVEFKYVTQ